ncbi:GTPase Ypt4 [Schizosaccharomyces cryophilus OY26]|uniref:GTPase Ypt4 n=1 Tax=Schizosaccharomyces cryophilus (strain OY26 / ATCC MYA-4695 / CBS 11777 / NBRC 106824 / NRRL Y48691) TaxID=653667 RepID=S9X638_SCHCR|nr:GTPase Ypt4 [Schizosaccharomyces cryophilus OY26]EPY52572.1 GTPase Ypt4 [Schizosaccharomyces cryophilus OY26]
MDKESYDYLVKIVLAGPSGTGKSCLLERFVKGRWNDEIQHTVGIDFASRIVIVGMGNQQKRIKIQLWDTAGQEKFRSVARNYYRGAAGAVLVYDITNKDSFCELSSWVSDIRAMAPSTLCVVLAGSKCDLQEQREVSTEEAAEFCSAKQIASAHETSAYSGTQVDDCFLSVVSTILTRIELGEIDPQDQSLGIQYGDLSSSQPSHNTSVTNWWASITNWDDLVRLERQTRSRCCL